MNFVATLPRTDPEARRSRAGYEPESWTVLASKVARIDRLPNPPVRRVTVVIDPARSRNVHRELVERLRRDGIEVTVQPGRTRRSVPSSVELLLALERMVGRASGPRPSDRIETKDWQRPQPAADDAPDLILDLCDDEPARGRPTLRILYDGVAGEVALFGALFAGRMPAIEVEDAQTGRILSRVVPCADNAATIIEAYACVAARLVNVLISLVHGWSMVASARPVAPASARLRDLVAFEIKTLAHAAIRSLYRLCCHAPHWRTCWRFVEGPDPWQTGTLAGTFWNVIPDPGFRFYADPFPFIHNGEAFVFVEDLDHRSNKALISVVPFGERGPTGPARPVLEEPWHLSYPFVFRHAGEIWMVPESVANRSVVLYRADPFPYRWVPEATLLADVEASDATILRHGGWFWMFAATRDGAGSWSDTLSIFSAADPRGPWSAHAANPILIDQRAARPAGAFIQRDGRLWRPVQDCSAGYGTGVGLAEVLRLDHSAYQQCLHSVLRPDPSWPGRRFHTLNRAGRLECIDGAAHSPRSRFLARHLQEWSGRREL